MAEQKVKDMLESLAGSEYRVAVLCLSYLAPDGCSHIAHGSSMQELDVSSAMDLIHMASALRQVAAGIDAMIAGAIPPELKVTKLRKTEAP